MKNIIRKIITEEINQKKDRLNRYILKSLKDENFDSTTSYSKILKFIKDNYDISGMEAFELYQLFVDNFGTEDFETDELRRTDITKKKFKTSNKTGRDLVTSRVPFKGNNTHAEYVRNTYVVYSYGYYPIYVYKDGQWFENQNKYSVSTAKQMSQLRPFTDVPIIKLNRDELKDLIYK